MDPPLGVNDSTPFARPWHEMSELAVATRPIQPAAEATGGFEAFFEEHHVRLFRALRLLTRDRAEAEDLTQEAFLRIWERWDRVERGSDPEAYLFRTAMNLWRSRLRRAAVAMRAVIHPSTERDEIGDVDQRDAVLRALAPLPPRQRAAVVLLDVLDLSSDQAGRALGIAPATVRVLAHRARAKLAESLGGGIDA